MNDQLLPIFSAAHVNSSQDIKTAIARVLDRHWYVLGEEVANFEQEFARYVGGQHCISVANGTDALELALKSLSVGPGDEVATVANAGYYSSTAIRSIGAIPVYVDVDDQSLTMSAERLRAVLTANTKAIIVTHLYGQMAAMDDILAVAKKAAVPVIEDCAQAHGARIGGRMAGSLGDVGCFSFYPTKNLGALGDGGAVVCHDDAVAQRLRALRQYGWSSKYVVDHAGGRNTRLDEMQAAVLRVKLPLLDSWNAQRRSIARLYNEAFSSLPMRLPVSLGEDFVAHLYVVRVDQRDQFRAHLKDANIATDVHYPIPDHLQKVQQGAKQGPSLTNTESASHSIVTLPCYPGLTAVEVQKVIAGVRSFYG